MTIAATGFFDGVHLGHSMVISKCVEMARECGGRSLVVTFWPHPRTVLQKDADKLRILTSMEEKRLRCLALGADDFAVIPFTRDFAALSAEEFVSEYLVGRYEVDRLVIGYDHHIGSDGIRDRDRLGRIIRGCGIEPVFVTGSVSSGGKPISSTIVRQELSAGRITSANSMLGYSYSLSGVVVSGNRIGRTIGFPTANLALYDPLKLIPATGVYAVRATLSERTFAGVCNIGTRPTLDDGRGLVVETHLLDFNEDIYGTDMRLEFVGRLRDERRFDSLDALRIQLEKDSLAARNTVLSL